MPELVAVVGLIGTATAVCSFIIAKSYRVGTVISENRLTINFLKDRVRKLEKRTEVLERATERRVQHFDKES